MRRVTLSLVIALLVSAFAIPVHADESIVSLTEVRFDRFGGLSESGTPSIAVWITCDGTGIITDLAVDVEQRGIEGFTNFDLLDAPCTTAPTRYLLQFDVFEGEFRPGKVTIVSAIELPRPGVEWGAGEMVILRKGALAQ